MRLPGPGSVRQGAACVALGPNREGELAEEGHDVPESAGNETALRVRDVQK